MKVKISRGKFEGINACANGRGVIAALAVDHRGNLLQEIARSRGKNGIASSADMLAIKTAVAQTLTLMPVRSPDPEYGRAITSHSRQRSDACLRKIRLRLTRGPSTRLAAEWSVWR
jgi:tagatose 1,6-diphosphate aldolase